FILPPRSTLFPYTTLFRSSQKFYHALKGLTDPEAKRKAIGKVFIDVFDEESKLVTDAKWLGQGTIYPDVIESVSATGGPSATIKDRKSTCLNSSHVKISYA